jgi:hypothetical protein
MEAKVYTSKLGAKFKLSDNHRPGEGDVVYFTRAEFEYMKTQKYNAEKFYGAYLVKRGDFRWSPIPDDVSESQAQMSARMAGETIEMLKGKHRT